MSTTPRLPSADDLQPANLGTVLAHAPQVMQAFGALYASFWQSDTVSPVMKETTRIRNARVTDCGY